MVLIILINLKELFWPLLLWYQKIKAGEGTRFPVIFKKKAEICGPASFQHYLVTTRQHRESFEKEWLLFLQHLI